jgi:hypothetical protein
LSARRTENANRKGNKKLVSTLSAKNFARHFLSVLVVVETICGNSETDGGFPRRAVALHSSRRRKRSAATKPDYFCLEFRQITRVFAKNRRRIYHVEAKKTGDKRTKPTVKRKL